MACGGFPEHSYRAVALCNNGRITKGDWRSGTSWKWSYAYCTRIGSSFHSGDKEWK
ncbi:hypothetical protein [Streptomyces crystallinus]|uniref:Uncharacterized protein n=1 Tax=Streptomyces crystallinus TaxID=68191 RepID=A0ABN1GJ14_9ACTN